MQTDRLISSRHSDSQKKKKKKKRRTCLIVKFDIPADHRMKLKESKKKENYIGLALELKNR